MEPINILLFCPVCFEQHVDAALPDVCQDCGHDKGDHCSSLELTYCIECASNPPKACMQFVAWLNPPHKSHRCNFCNHVWRPADVPTNGVQALETKGERDGSPRPIAFANGKDFDYAVQRATDDLNTEDSGRSLEAPKSL
jgi:hypothetical protein